MEFCAEAVEKWEGSGNTSTINNLVIGCKSIRFLELEGAESRH
jgi:hypothetical protein